MKPRKVARRNAKPPGLNRKAAAELGEAAGHALALYGERAAKAGPRILELAEAAKLFTPNGREHAKALAEMSCRAPAFAEFASKVAELVVEAVKSGDGEPLRQLADCAEGVAKARTPSFWADPMWPALNLAWIAHGRRHDAQGRKLIPLPANELRDQLRRWFLEEGLADVQLRRLGRGMDAFNYTCLPPKHGGARRPKA